MPDLGCWGGEIIPKDEDGYKPHSAILKCRCEVTGWHTKNIGYIGARNIYSFAGGCDWMKEHMTCSQKECTCPSSDLSVDEDLVNHVKNCEECKQYGL
ncbi:hypothetical protein KA005_00950 [bacterium]|nr:hypothetical protein [bacterium]